MFVIARIESARALPGPGGKSHVPGIHGHGAKTGEGLRPDPVAEVVGLAHGMGIHVVNDIAGHRPGHLERSRHGIVPHGMNLDGHELLPGEVPRMMLTHEVRGIECILPVDALILDEGIRSRRARHPPRQGAGGDIEHSRHLLEIGAQHLDVKDACPGGQRHVEFLVRQIRKARHLDVASILQDDEIQSGLVRDPEIRLFEFHLPRVISRIAGSGEEHDTEKNHWEEREKAHRDTSMNSLREKNPCKPDMGVQGHCHQAITVIAEPDPPGAWGKAPGKVSGRLANW